MSKPNFFTINRPKQPTFFHALAYHPGTENNDVFVPVLTTPVGDPEVLRKELYRQVDDMINVIKNG